jgi:hypothetical protein
MGTISIDRNEIAYDQSPTDSISDGETQITFYEPDKMMTYFNPDISNGQIVFQGRSDSDAIYLFDGSDILTIDEIGGGGYCFFKNPFLRRGHIIYLQWKYNAKVGKDANRKIFPHIRANITEKSDNNYSNNLKNIYYKPLSNKSEFNSKQMKNIELNNKVYKTRTIADSEYVQCFDGKHINTIDRDTAYDYPYFESYRFIGTAYGYSYYIKGYSPQDGNSVVMAYEEGSNLKQKTIWHDYYSNYPVTGYSPIYKGNFVFSAYDGNDYELYLYMGDTTNCVPAVPEGVHYTTSTKSNEVQLYWNKAEDASLYRIYRSASSHNYGTYYAATSDTLYIDTDIPGNTVYYKISSMQGNKESGLSKQITINDFDTIGPIAPESLRITNIDTIAMELSLAWNKSLSSDVEKYLIYKKTGIFGEFNIYDSTENSIMVYNDTDVQFEINYFYKTNAMDYKGNEGAYSNEIDTIIAHSSGISLKKAKQFSIRYSTIQSNGVFLFKLTNGIGKRIDTRIYDLSGRTIYKKIITPSSANVIERANIKKNGIYFIEFKYNKNRYIKKIVIL